MPYVPCQDLVVNLLHAYADIQLALSKLDDVRATQTLVKVARDRMYNTGIEDIDGFINLFQTILKEDPVFPNRELIESNLEMASKQLLHLAPSWLACDYESGQ